MHLLPSRSLCTSSLGPAVRADAANRRGSSGLTRWAPGQSFATIGEVALGGPAAGRQRAHPLAGGAVHEKWVICARGTEAEPITIRGVAGPNGEPTCD